MKITVSRDGLKNVENNYGSFIVDAAAYVSTKSDRATVQDVSQQEGQYIWHHTVPTTNLTFGIGQCKILI